MLHEIDLSRVDLNLLVLFDAVMAERHVGRTAGRLSLSPSAVSHGLGRLRRLLDDPVFQRTPKGVVPTARALELAGPVGRLLADARAIVAVARPFDARTTSREFTIGAPDGATTLFLLPLLTRLRREAPGIDLRLRQLLPPGTHRTQEPPWQAAFVELDARGIDLAVGPFDDVPARFDVQSLGEEDFVIVSRPGHPFAIAPGLQTYCAADHLVVSQAGDARGFVDDALARRGLERRVALTVPSFFMSLALVSATDLIAAVPRRFARAHAKQAGAVVTEPPLLLPRFVIRTVVTRAARADAGLLWLRDAVAAAAPPSAPRRRRK